MEQINALVTGLGLESDDNETLIYRQVIKIFYVYPAKPERSPDQNEVALYKFLFKNTEQIFAETHFNLMIQIFGLM